MFQHRSVVSIALIGLGLLTGCAEAPPTPPEEPPPPDPGCTDAPAVCTPMCGDGVIAGSETCDDGNTSPKDGCSAACWPESGFTCTGAPSVCVTQCGDGITAGSEQCDDGNAAVGDGCDASCHSEGPACGDGAIASSEACDDGNVTDGDGCTSGCQVEQGFTCSGIPSLCCVGETEPNNGASMASPLPLGALGCGSITPGSESDFFSFTLPDVRDVAIDIFDGSGPGQCSSIDPELFFYQPNGQTLIFSDDDSGISSCAKIDPILHAPARKLMPGTYYARVVEHGGAMIIPAYMIRVQASFCGDGIVEGSEQCDGTVNCTSYCKIVGTCGNGFLEGMEQCDDLNMISGDGCDTGCQVEPDYVCTGEPSTCAIPCGDGILQGVQPCDDGNISSGDGCSGTCQIEQGYTCSGAPSLCVTTCGDGIAAGPEGCDDGNQAGGDGCNSSCQVEPGYDCGGLPSTCAPVCGDGLVIAPEGCDDSNMTFGDGCTPLCQIESGYGCSGMPSACAPICGDGMLAGLEACDDGNASGGDGCSAACAIEPGYSCSGLPSLCTAGCGDGAVAGSEACDDGNATEGDGCSGVCQIETGFTCGGSPSVCVPICGDGIATIAEGCDDGNTIGGDGCDSACQVEPGYECPGSPSVCCMFEIEPNNGYSSATPLLPTGAPRCGRIDPAGDGDYFAFTLLATSDITIETFNASGPGHCDANTNTWIFLYDVNGQTELASSDDAGVPPCSRIAPLTHPNAKQRPPGTYYVRVIHSWNAEIIPAYTLSVKAIGCGDGVIDAPEQCDSGPSCAPNCTVTTPGPGESRQTAEPFLGCPLAPSSDARLQVPYCFPPSGPVQWYSYVAADDATVISADTKRAVAIIDDMGQLIRCTSDAKQFPAATFSGTGKTIYIVMSVQSPIGCLTVNDIPYYGLKGNLTDLNVTFPSSATSDYGMAASATQIFLGTTSKVFAFPKTGNTVAVEHGASDGLMPAHLGYDLHFANGSLFSLDDNAASSANRLFRIFDGNGWGPSPWDAPPSYPEASRAVTFDGTSLISATFGVTAPMHFFAHSPAAPSKPQLLGKNSSIIRLTGIAADQDHIYVAGDDAAGQGIFRLDRTNLAASAVRIASIFHPSSEHTSVVIDNAVQAGHLYVRDGAGNIHVIADPGGAAKHLGAITTLGQASDFAMTYDRFANVIYFFETELNANGRVFKVQ